MAKKVETAAPVKEGEREELQDKINQEAAAELDFDNMTLSSLGSEEEFLAATDLSNYGEVNDTCEYPHIKVATKSLRELLKVATQITTAAGRDLISKAVNITVENGEAVFRVTDFENYLSRKLPILNQENVLKEVISIPVEVLVKLIKAAPVNTVIYVKDDEVMIRLVGGEMPLETINADNGKFQYLDEVIFKKTVSAPALYSVLKDFGGIISSAVSPSERRVVFTEKMACASYMWAIITAPGDFYPMDMKIKDLAILKTLLTGSSEDLKVYETTDDVKVKRVVIESNAFKYAFMISDLGVSESLLNRMDQIITAPGTHVDFVQFYKMVELSADLPYSIGKLGVNMDPESSSLVLAMKTKKSDDSIFLIPGATSDKLVRLAKDFALQAKLMKIVLRSFASASSIRISVNEDGIAISTDQYSSVIYSELD